MVSVHAGQWLRERYVNKDRIDGRSRQLGEESKDGGFGSRSDGLLLIFCSCGPSTTFQVLNYFV